MVELSKQTGNLSDTSAADILLWISAKGFTGVLVLAKDEVKKSIVFENGKPVSARSNVLEESLGHLLVKEGRLTEGQLSKSLQMIENKEAVRQGEALLSMGLIDHALLTEILHRQLLSRIYQVFTWEEGRYALLSDIPEDTAKITIPESLNEICFRGLLLKYKGSEEAKTLDPKLKPIPVGGMAIDLTTLRLVGREMGMFRALTGVSTIADVAQKSRLDEETVRAMLLSFRDMGIVRVGEARMSVESPRREAPQKPKKDAAQTSAFISDAQQRVSEIGKKTYYEILGVARETSTADIKKAYFDQAKIFHPDRLPPGTSSEDRKIIELLFAKISEAHAMLANDASRKEYDATLSLEDTGMDAQKAEMILRSEVEFQKGQALIRKGDFGGAVDLLKRAIEMYDGEPEYGLFLGWALFRNSTKTKNLGDARNGRQLIEKAIAANEKLVQGFYFLGMIAKAEGDLAKAKKFFERTLSQAPKHMEATSELRVLNMREEKQQTGGLKGLFRKKE